MPSDLSAEDFSRILGEWTESLGLTEKDLAREFGVSKPTVCRWLSGASAPYPLMRKQVLGWLLRRFR